MAKRFNPYYNRTNTCDNIKEDGSKCEEKLYPRHAHREYNDKGNWTGRWFCGKCWGRNYQRNDSRSGNNLIKSMTDCRTKDLYNKYFHELIERGFDTLIVLCMDENRPWKIVERVYIILCKELSVQKIDIYKNTPRILSKWEKFRIDERPYGNTYQKMRKIYNALKGDYSI